MLQIMAVGGREKRKAVTFFCFYTILWHSHMDLPQSVLRNITAFSNWHFIPLPSTGQNKALCCPRVAWQSRTYKVEVPSLALSFSSPSYRAIPIL